MTMTEGDIGESKGVQEKITITTSWFDDDNDDDDDEHSVSTEGDISESKGSRQETGGLPARVVNKDVS